MSGPLTKLLRNPRRYVPVARKAMLGKLSGLFKRASFHLQAQMDIHPSSRWFPGSEIVARTGGFFLRGDGCVREICDLEAHDSVRRDMLILLLRTLTERNVAGALAELGVYQGLTAKLIHYYAPERRLYLFDTFAGFTARGAQAEAQHTGFHTTSSKFADTSLERVKAYVRAKNSNVSFHPGFFPDSVPPGLERERFAFVHLDADLYEPTLAGLEFFFPRMERGGIIAVHDYNAWVGARAAVDRFFAARSELPIPMPDKSGSVVIVKQ